MGKQRTLPRGRRTKVATVVGSILLVATACGPNAPAPASRDASGAVSPAPSASDAPAGREIFSGTFKVTYGDGDIKYWNVVSCGPGCADVSQKQDGPTPSTVQGRAEFKGKTWTMTISRPDAFVCHDGSEHAGPSVWTWDATTLEGVFSGQPAGDICGDGKSFPDQSFTLTKERDEALPPGYRSS